jgi:hypothetical protein
MIKIIVDTKEEKKEFLEAIEHIRYSDVDTDLPMINKIIYLDENDVVIKNESECS